MIIQKLFTFARTVILPLITHAGRHQEGIPLFKGEDFAVGIGDRTAALDDVHQLGTFDGRGDPLHRAAIPYAGLEAAARVRV